jgi:hypothetical protein
VSGRWRIDDGRENLALFRRFFGERRRAEQRGKLTAPVS